MIERIKGGKHPGAGLVVLALTAFIALGMPDGVLGVAWPSIRAGFSLPLDAVGLLIVASTTGYLTSTFLSGLLVARMGIGLLLAASCALTGAGLIGYTVVPDWWMMVLLGTAAGLGAGAIDAGLNTYAAAHFSAGLMQWLHASYGVGATLGPVIMTAALTTMNSWRMGYILLGGFQLILAISFALTLPVWNIKTAGEDAAPRLTDYRTPLGKTLRHPGSWLSMLLFFLYTGSEFSLGTWTYSLLTESRGIRPEVAGLWAGSYWATFTAGRFAAGLYAGRAGVDRMVRGSLLTALLGTLLWWWNPAPAANLAAVGLIGLAIAPIYPALTTGTSRRVGVSHAANTIGMQMAAGSLGCAAIPALIGVLARRISLEIIPIAITCIFTALLILHALAAGKNPDGRNAAPPGDAPQSPRREKH